MQIKFNEDLLYSYNFFESSFLIFLRILNIEILVTLPLGSWLTHHFVLIVVYHYGIVRPEVQQQHMTHV